MTSLGTLEYKVNAASGEIVKVEEERIRGRLFTFITGLNLKEIEGAKMAAAEAVALAERETVAKAIMLAVEHDQGRIEYEIFLRAGDKPHKVKIDGGSGQILSKH